MVFSSVVLYYICNDVDDRSDTVVDYHMLRVKIDRGKKRKPCHLSGR